MVKKLILPTIIFLLIISIVMACKESYLSTEDVIIFDSVEEYGSGANCNISLFNDTDIIYANLTMEMDGLKYNYSFGKDLPAGIYRTSIECKKDVTINCTDIYLGECNFTVEQEVESEYYLYVVSIIVFFALLSLAYYVEEPVFAIVSGMLSIVIAVNIFVNGFPNLTNEFLKNGITIVLVGIGFYFILAPSIEFFENFQDRLSGESE